MQFNYKIGFAIVGASAIALLIHLHLISSNYSQKIEDLSGDVSEKSKLIQEIRERTCEPLFVELERIKLQHENRKAEVKNLFQHAGGLEFDMLYEKEKPEANLKEIYSEIDKGKKDLSDLESTSRKIRNQIANCDSL